MRVASCLNRGKKNNNIYFFNFSLDIMNLKFKKTDAKKRFCVIMITIIKKNLERQSNLCGLGSVGGNTCELYIMHEVAYDLWPMGGVSC